MFKGLVYSIIAFLALSIVKLPWLASAVYLATSILQPQAIWFWALDGIPIYKISAGMAIIGFIIMVMRKEIDWSGYWYKQNLFIILIWALVNLSDIFSPFPVYTANVNSEILLGTFNTIVLMYFILVGTLNHEKGLKVLTFLFMGVIAYYIYWANSTYFNQDWSQFRNNRLMGPENSPFKDGNVFAVLFVIIMPFFLFGFYYFKTKIIRVSCLLIIPFLWHAVLLTSSRGALLALCIMTLLCAFMLKSKILNILLCIGFSGFILTQGQIVIDRAYDTYHVVKENSGETANPRLVSWEIGVDLAFKHPLFGVGPQRFVTASRAYFPGKSPHIAHNTLISIAANNGIIAMVFYAWMLLSVWGRFRNTKQHFKHHQEQSFWGYILDASTIGILGFFITSFFLDLLIFEAFYLLILINMLGYHQFTQTLKVARDGEEEALDFSVRKPANEY